MPDGYHAPRREPEPSVEEQLKPLLRPLFAALAMAGALAADTAPWGGFRDSGHLSRSSVEVADALLAALAASSPHTHTK